METGLLKHTLTPWAAAARVAVVSAVNVETVATLEFAVIFVTLMLLWLLRLFTFSLV
jgi:hypothetical protein